MLQACTAGIAQGSNAAMPALLLVCQRCMRCSMHGITREAACTAYMCLNMCWGVQSMALDPRYGSRKTREFMTGGLAGQVALNSRVSKDTITCLHTWTGLIGLCHYHSQAPVLQHKPHAKHYLTQLCDERGKANTAVTASMTPFHCMTPFQSACSQDSVPDRTMCFGVTN